MSEINMNKSNVANAIFRSFCPGLLVLLFLAAAPAHAQSNRTWVSGTGDDASVTCSRAAPCASFAVALIRTNAGGEINCLDSGSYGTSTITTSISIICEGVVGGVTVPANSYGMQIAAAATDTIVLRGLDFQGVGGVTTTGIHLQGGGALHIENSRFRDLARNGIQLFPAAAIELYVTDTTISNNGSAGGGGILLQAAAGSTTKVTVNRSNVQNNATGIKAAGGASGVINMTIRDTASVGNTQNGIVGTTSAGGAAVVMMLDRVAASHNAAGYGIIADGPLTFITVGRSSVAGNAFGVGTSHGGTLLSLKTNQIRGNSSDGTPIAAVGLE